MSTVVRSGLQDIRDLLKVRGSGGPNIQVGDVGGFPTHQYYSGRILSLGDTMNYGEAANTAGGWDLGLPTSGGSGVGGGFGGVLDLCLPLP